MSRKYKFFQLVFYANKGISRGPLGFKRLTGFCERIRKRGINKNSLNVIKYDYVITCRLGGIGILSNIYYCNFID